MNGDRHSEGSPQDSSETTKQGSRSDQPNKRISGGSGSSRAASIKGADAKGRGKTFKLSEADIERTCSDYLALDGWRMLKTNPCSDRSRAKGFGEKGMADCLYIRYLGRNAGLPPGSPHRVHAELLWIEWKRPDGVLSDHQMDWQVAEQRRGALVVTLSSIELFLEWYRASGLNRGKV